MSENQKDSAFAGCLSLKKYFREAERKRGGIFFGFAERKKLTAEKAEKKNDFLL